MVFVRGPEQCEIQHFVEKVVFWLHDSFPKPRRGEWSSLVPSALFPKVIHVLFLALPRGVWRQQWEEWKRW
jgi:hypothetical protein